MNTLTYEEALEIYNEMERLVDRTDEDILYLYNSLIERAIRYAHTNGVSTDVVTSWLEDGHFDLVNVIDIAEGF